MSNYKDGDQLQYKFEKYIYNYTQRDIAINTKNKFYGTETTDSVVIKKGKIYGFDWMIDTATVSYTTDNIDKNENKKPETNTNTNTDKPDSNKQNNSNKNTNTTKKTGTINNKNTNNVNNTKPDTTVAKTKLPKTGTYGIIFISGFSFVTMMVIWVKLKKYEDVK